MLKDGCIFFGSEVTVVAATLGVGKNDSVDQLTKAELTSGSS